MIKNEKKMGGVLCDDIKVSKGGGVTYDDIKMGKRVRGYVLRF